MNKIEAISQVVQMTKLAESTTHEGEAQVAREQITRLRLKHGISDADLAATVSQSDTEEFVFFGHKMFYYRREITPIVVEIQALIDRACAKLNTEDVRTRMEGYCKFFSELRWLLDPKVSYNHRPELWERGPDAYEQIRAFKQLQERRDQAVRDFYHEEYLSHAGIRGQGDPNREHPTSWDHRWARDITAMHSDLRKPQVETIVGVKEDDLIRKEEAEEKLKNGRITMEDA